MKFQKPTTKNPSDGELRKDLNIFEEDAAAEDPKELEEIKEVLANIIDNDYKYVLFSFKLERDIIPKLKIRFYLALFIPILRIISRQIVTLKIHEHLRTYNSM